MIIKFELGDSDPEVKICRDHTPSILTIDPRLTILQVHRSILEILTFDEFNRYLAKSALVISSRITSPALSVS